MAKVLVTGSTGFIGKRLIYQLLEQGHEVYALIRIRGTGLTPMGHPHLHILYADLRDPSSISPFPEGIQAAYYLVHSMGNTIDNLVEEEETVAHHFLSAVEKTKCQQIIFLTGIIEDEKVLSPHLRSRLAVEKVLKTSQIPSTILRASIIIGAGSASFEIIRDLVEKLPFMVAPKWIKNECQPIAIRDVLFYLTHVLLEKNSFGKIYDIGGPEVLSFKEILLRYAEFRGLRRLILEVPVLTPKLSSYWLVFITSVRLSICRHLIESMKHHTRKLNPAIDTLIPHDCITYEEALTLAFQKIHQNEVVSTWMDAWELSKYHASLQDFVEVPQEGCLNDQREVSITIPLPECQLKVWSLGGNQGWHSMDWAWRLRGLIDQFLGGIGLNRGRRHPNKLEAGDSLDFWRVILADEKKRHLILYAEMKLPGEAWLEFEINEEKKTLKQTATFRPKGFLGRMYWYMLVPFHGIIFKNMARDLSQRPFKE